MNQRLLHEIHACIPYSQGPTRPTANMDLESKVGATTLAKVIEQYWHRLGFTDVWVRAKPGNGAGYRVVSNLINGLPPAAFNGAS